jgi:4-hydroxy-3-polyprenylbenzoate decarboxylase
MGCLLQRLRVAGFETHWAASPAGVLNAHHELGLDRAWLERLADQAHNPAEIGATIAGGSFTTQAMVVAPVRDGQRQR